MALQYFQMKLLALPFPKLFENFKKYTKGSSLCISNLFSKLEKGTLLLCTIATRIDWVVVCLGKTLHQKMSCFVTMIMEEISGTNNRPICKSILGINTSCFLISKYICVTGEQTVYFKDILEHNGESYAEIYNCFIGE